MDAVNGAAALALPQMLEALGCELITINCTPNGKFPRGAEPLPHNLKQLGKAVKKYGAHVGFATDPDGDRLAVVDELGNPLENITIQYFTEDNGYSPYIVTNSTGQFQNTIFIPQEQTEIFEMEIVIQEGTKVYQVTNELEIIPQSNVVLLLSANDAYRGKNVTINVHLESEDGTALDNETVKYSLLSNIEKILSDNILKLFSIILLMLHQILLYSQTDKQGMRDQLE